MLFPVSEVGPPSVTTLSFIGGGVAAFLVLTVILILVVFLSRRSSGTRYEVPFPTTPTSYCNNLGPTGIVYIHVLYIQSPIKGGETATRPHSPLIHPFRRGHYSTQTKI